MAESLLSIAAIEELTAIATAAPPGAFAEFGVYQGGVAERLAAIAHAQGRALYLFDTFTGIPFSGEHDRHQVGDFSNTSLEAVRALIPDAIIIPGIFPESLEIHSCIPAPLAFVHVDADQYESLRAAIRIFPPLMVPGGAMLFDDYGCLPGATRAVREWGEPIQITANDKALWRKP